MLVASNIAGGSAATVAESRLARKWRAGMEMAAAEPGWAALREGQDEGSGFVPGWGSLRRSVVALVGEAPGRQEARGGAPFIGQSGAVLGGLLKAVGLERSSCYITNVVKYRPPGNRTPAFREILAGEDHLRAELALLSCRRLICLGAVARDAICGPFGSAMQGQVVNGRGSWLILPVLHPAVAMYRGQAGRQQMLSQWTRGWAMMDEIDANWARVQAEQPD